MTERLPDERARQHRPDEMPVLRSGGETARPEDDAGELAIAFRMLSAQGFEREALLTKHRAQIDYQSPGFAEWLERAT